MAWSENEIIFYFGTESQNQIEIGRTPLPPGADISMYTILSRFGAVAPTQPNLDDALASNMDIDYVKIYAPKPAEIDVRLDADAVRGSGDAGANRIEGNALDNVLDGDLGLDWARGNGGADLFVLRHGGAGVSDNHLVVEDFDPREGDKILVEGLYLLDAADAYASLHEVGDDVWLSRGAGGTTTVGPQTVILRDTRIADLDPDDFVVRWGDTRSPGNVGYSRLYETDGDVITVHGTDKDDRLSSYFHGGFFPVPRIDQLRGGDGDDTYRMLTDATPIVERPGEGRDEVLLERTSFTLPVNVENLTVAANQAGRVTVVGNDADNVVRAHDGGLRVAGQGDDDLIVLGDGGDVVHIGPGDGRDTIENFADADVVTFGAGFFANRSEVLTHLRQEGDDVGLYLTAADAVRFRDARVDEFTAANFGFAVTLGQNLATHPNGGFAGAEPTPHVGEVPAWGPWLNGVATPTSGEDTTPPPADDPPAVDDGEAILAGPGLTATLNGAARFDDTSGLFTLTPAATRQVGSAMLDEAIDLGRDFSVVVDLRPGTDDAGADGMALVLHDDPRGPNAVGAVGTTGARSIAAGLAFDVDTYDNGATAGDIAADHANIFDTDGDFTTAPFALADVEDGRPHRVAVSWDASARRLEYSVDGSAAGALESDVAASRIGSPFAYFGITAGTGGAVNTHQARIAAIDATLADGRTIDWNAVAPNPSLDLVWSRSASRTGPQDLRDARLTGDVYVFLDDDGATGIDRVAFYLDDSDAGGTPLQIERSAPWDLQGGFAAAAEPFDVSALAPGRHSVTAEVLFDDGAREILSESFEVAQPSPATDLVWSDSADRSDAVDLEGAELAGDAYVFLDPAGRTDIVEVNFWLDDPDRSGAPVRTEGADPWDFRGGFAAAAEPWDTGGTTPGSHSITAEVVFDDGAREIVSESFETADATTDLVWSTSPSRTAPADLAGATLSDEVYVFLDPAGRSDIEEVEFWLDDADRSGAPTRREGAAPWDFQGGFLPAAEAWRTTEVADGAHSMTAEVHFTDGSSEAFTESFFVDNLL